MKTFVTFGQAHTHSCAGKTLDKDTVAVYEAPSVEAGRKKAFDLFGDKFFTTYTEDTWDEDYINFYPKGYVQL